MWRRPRRTAAGTPAEWRPHSPAVGRRFIFMVRAWKCLCGCRMDALRRRHCKHLAYHSHRPHLPTTQPPTWLKPSSASRAALERRVAGASIQYLMKAGSPTAHTWWFCGQGRGGVRRGSAAQRRVRAQRVLEQPASARRQPCKLALVQGRCGWLHTAVSSLAPHFSRRRRRRAVQRRSSLCAGRRAGQGRRRRHENKAGRQAVTSYSSNDRPSCSQLAAAA